MKCAILRTTTPGRRVAYVRNVGHDGGFGLTFDKAKARTFAPETAVAARARLAATGETFTICPAPNVGPVAFPHVCAAIEKAEGAA